MLTSVVVGDLILLVRIELREKLVLILNYILQQLIMNDGIPVNY